MINKIKIISTLGPSSLNSQFLNYANKNIDLLRLNMSHKNQKELIRNIKYIKKFSSCPICIDTEGAQIRSKFKSRKLLKINSIVKITSKNSKLFNLYPQYVLKKLKLNDVLNIGFENLKVKIIKIYKENFLAKVISSGYLENNKGIHLENRKIKLNYLTDKDLDAIEI